MDSKLRTETAGGNAGQEPVDGRNLCSQRTFYGWGTDCLAHCRTRLPPHPGKLK
ncbi:MAG: hypothetical protein N3B16_04555 [Candidatus Aminicenantes bacterium]|nr:hypothetical protein [Candidatus Aminicenantes bacterium]